MRTRIATNGSSFAKIFAQLRFVPRLLVLLALLGLGSGTAQARGPVLNLFTNVINLAQGASTNILFTIQDDAVGWSGIQTITAGFVTNGIFSNTILAVTNFESSYGPPPGWTNSFAYETNKLTITPGNQYGTNAIMLISTDIWGDTTTNRWLLNVFHVSQAPSFTLATNRLVVPEESGRQTNRFFVSGITNGAGNAPGLTWTFAATTSATTTNNGGTKFLIAPLITNYNGTNGLTADLVFAPTNHSSGSNLVTVVMTDSGVVSGGGRIARTNTFWLVVSHIAHAPVITGITNRTTLENGGTLSGVVIGVRGDVAGQLLDLKVISQNTNMASATVTATNSVNSTNSQFTLAFTPVLNAFGAVTNLLIARQGTGGDAIYTTNSVILTVTHVSQPPSFSLATNSLAVLEECGAQTNVNFATAISSGVGNPVATLGQLTFAVTTVTNTSANAQFTLLPTLGVTNGVLRFTPQAHSYGTNLVTVTLTDTIESTNNGGIKTYSTTFLLKVAQISHAPLITPVATQNTLENGSGTNVVVNVWNYDALTNNLALTAVAQNTNLALVSVIATNVISATNTQFTLHFTPLTNKYGTNVITLTAANLSGATNTTSTNFNLLVTHVSQPPSFVFSTNTVTTPKQATSALVTLTSFLRTLSAGPGNLPGSNWNFTLTAADTTLFTTNSRPAVSTNGTLTFTPARLTNGTTSVSVVMRNTNPGESTANGGVITFTNTFTLTIYNVSLTPSFAFATNMLVVPEESAAQTNVNFVTAINTGLGKSSAITWTFATATATNDPANNAQFTAWPTIATNGTLTFAPLEHSYGTNLVTVIMTDSGGTNGSCTNTFQLAVAQIAHAPSIMWATNQTTLENGGGLTAVVNVWDYDSCSNNLLLTAVASNSSVAQVSVVATNWISATNVQFTLALNPVTDMYGSSIIQLTASEVVGTNLLSSTTNFLLTVPQVSQPPSFAFATNILIVPEHAGTINYTNFLTGITAGAGNPPGLTWTFAVATQPGAGNVAYAPFQSPTVTTNGTLSFSTLDYAYGTNQITIVMTDSGISINNGLIKFTNTFALQVPWVNQAPSFDLGASTTTVDKFNVPVTISNAAINILTGPNNGNENSQTITFLNASVANSSLLTAQPQIDANGTLTFTPGNQPGTVTLQVYAQDTGGTADGGVDVSTNHTFTIIIPANTFETASGNYVNLFYGTNKQGTASSGYVSLALITNGVFSGYVLCDNSSNAFNGQFNIAQSSATAQAGNETLTLTIDTATKVITGSVTNTVAHWNSSLRGYLSGYGAALDGSYVMAMPGFNLPRVGTAGDSTFGITIASGSAALTGKLADSNQVNQVSLLCTNGYTPVYLPLYTNANGANGLLIGWLNFNDVAHDSASPGSTLIWIGRTNASLLYPNGFTNNVVPLLSTFDAAQPQLLPINKGYVQMSGGGLTIPLVQAVTLVNNQILVDPTISNGLALLINTNTGAVQGSFVDSDGYTNLIESVILENDQVARGYFLGAGQSGSFILVANAVLPHDPPYPAFIVHTNGPVTIVGAAGAAGITNLVIAENSPTNNLRLSITLYDPLKSTFNVTATSANTNVVDVLLTGSGVQRQLFFQPVLDVYGSNITVTVTADDGTLTNTFTINTTISFVNEVPSFALATNAYTVDKYGLLVTAPAAVTTISAGPASENWQTVNFLVTNSNPSLFLVQPAIDTNGDLTFTPGSVGGTVTVGVRGQDTGGTGNNGVNTTVAQLLTITIPSNPFNSLLSGAGSFIGLFSDTNAVTPDLASSGYFSLVLTNSGTFNGSLICAGATNAFTGQFSIAQSNATVTVAGYTLNLLLDPGAATVTGTVVNGWTATLQSYLADTTSLAGNYLVALPGLASSTAGPVGDSTFTVNIGSDGVAALTGKLADNTGVTLTSHLSATGNCPVYLPIYTNNAHAGLLFGWLTFTNDAANNLTAASALTWFNDAGATPALYPAGFTNQTVPVASTYVDATPNNLPGFSHYAVLTGGSFGASLVTNVVTIVNDVLAIDPAAGTGLTLTVNPTTGELTGTFVDAGVTNYIESLILQNTNVARGYFTSASGDASGSFVLLGTYSVPANYTYPEFTGLTNLTLLENASTFSMSFSLFDPLTNDFASVTASSADTGFVTVSVTGSGLSRALLITPVANSFTNDVAISIVADDGNLINTNVIHVAITWVNQTPSFTLDGTTVTVDQYSVPVTVSNKVSAISVGLDHGSGVVNFIVTNNANGRFLVQPAVDANGTLTFTPGSVGGSVIVGVQAHDDQGTANNGVDTSASQTFTITIPPNQFQDVTGTNLTGTLTGLFYDTNGVVPNSSGYVTLTLTNDGSFNVNLINGGTTNSVDGHFSVAQASASVTVASYGLELTIDTAAGTVIGSVTNTTDHWNVPLQTYLAASPAITPGSYTVLLPGFDDLTEGPTGYSVFNVGINSNGVATFVGSMADNTPASQVAHLSAAGYCPIYIPLYPNGTNGLVIGWLTFTNDPTYLSLTEDSTLMWFNTAGATPSLYPNGFTNQAPVLASPYATDSGYENNLLGASSSGGYGYVMLSGGDLGANPIVKKMSLTNNIISVVSSRDHSISLNISTNTGMINGWYIDPRGFSNNITGAIFQNDAFAAGYFSGANTNQSGLFMLFGN